MILKTLSDFFLGDHIFKDSACRNASRSLLHESGDMPSLTTCRLHFPRTPHTSLCLHCNKLPPDATLFEAIF